MKLVKLALVIASIHPPTGCGSEKEQTFSIHHQGSEWTVLYYDVVRAQAWANSLLCLGESEGNGLGKSQ